MQSPDAWLATPLGHYLLDCEFKYVDEAVADVFGYNALQLGLPEHDFLRASRIPFKCHVARAGPAGLLARFRDLPIATNSIDLLVLPHVLEFSVNPHQILREVQRVLMPEGHAVIACFNPWSLWGVRRLFNRTPEVYPWDANFITLPRLKDWLALLELEIAGGKMGCYVPPFAQDLVRVDAEFEHVRQHQQIDAVSRDRQIAKAREQPGRSAGRDVAFERNPARAQKIVLGQPQLQRVIAEDIDDGFVDVFEFAVEQVAS